jgi:hypothetical protein
VQNTGRSLRLLEQIVDFPTHIKGNCLDLILTNMRERLYDETDVGNLGSSDHVMISCSIVINDDDVDTAKTTINWRKADWNTMRRDMAGVNWSNEFDAKTVQEMWNLFSSKIGKTVSENVPEGRQQNGGRPAWLNREIKVAINRNRHLWKKAKGGSGVEEYREADKKVKDMIQMAKRNYEKRPANEKGSSNRPFYAYLKKKSKSRSTIGPLKDKENF